MTTWHPIDTAPLSAWVTEVVQTVRGPRNNVELRREWVWSYRAPDGHMTPSYWQPRAQRWVGYTQDAPPTHWSAYRPDPPTLGELQDADTARRSPGPINRVLP